MSLLRRITPIALALAAACGIYGEDGKDAPAPAPTPGADAAVVTGDAAIGDPPVVSDQDSGLDPEDSSAPDSTTPVVDAGIDQAGPMRDLYAFVTSVPISGKLASINPEINADNLCNQLAAVRPKLVGRTYAAWLGMANASAQDRIANKAIGHRYLRLDDKVITDDPKHMAGNTLQNAISISDNDLPMNNTQVWSGVGIDGQNTASNCLNWSSDSPTNSAFGGIVNTSESWSQFTLYSCDKKLPIYCFELP